jgi:hypothetical protein
MYTILPYSCPLAGSNAAKRSDVAFAIQAVGLRFVRQRFDQLDHLIKMRSSIFLLSLCFCFSVLNCAFAQEPKELLAGLDGAGPTRTRQSSRTKRHPIGCRHRGGRPFIAGSNIQSLPVVADNGRRHRQSNQLFRPDEPPSDANQ